MKHAPIIILSTLACTVAACATTTDEESSESALGVGTGVLVTAPPGFSGPIAPTTVGCNRGRDIDPHMMSVHAPEHTFKYGEPAGLASGDYTCILQTDASAPFEVDSPYAKPFQVQVTPGEMTTFITALLAIDATDSSASEPLTLGLRRTFDIVHHEYTLRPEDRSFSLTIKAPVPEFEEYHEVYHAHLGSGIRMTSDGSVYVPVVPGEHVINYGVAMLDGARLDLASGEARRIDLARETEGRQRALLQVPPRTLPTAACPTLGLPSPWTFYLGAINREFVSEEMPHDVYIGMRHGGPAEIVTLFQHNWQGVRLELKLGAVGGPPAVTALGRVEVPGSGGTYELRRIDENGAVASENFLRCTPPTGTGVDVPKGKYEVRVTTNGEVTSSIVEAISR